MEPSPPPRLEQPAPDELTLAQRQGLVVGGALALVVFGGPACVGALLEAAAGRLDPRELPLALLLVLALTAGGAVLGRALVRRGLLREGPLALEEAARWRPLPDGEPLEGACPATLFSAEGVAPGVLVLGARSVRFLACEGSRRRLTELGSRELLTVAAASWAPTPALLELAGLRPGGLRFTFRGEAPARWDLDVGVRRARLLAWLGAGPAPPPEGPELPLGSPRWEERRRPPRGPSDLRLVSRPLRVATARGALAAGLAFLLAAGPLAAACFGGLVAALAGLEEQLRPRGRLARNLGALGGGLLAAGVLVGIAAQEQARAASGGVLTVASYVAGARAALELADGQVITGLQALFLVGAALACGLATAWRTRAPWAGLLLAAGAAGTLAGVVNPETWFLIPHALLGGTQLAVGLVFLAVAVDATDRWLLARYELRLAPSWSEALVDAIRGDPPAPAEPPDPADPAEPGPGDAAQPIKA